MCINTAPNVLERLKLLKFIGIDILFFNQIALYLGVLQGDKLEIENAVFSKRTSRNWTSLKCQPSDG